MSQKEIIEFIYKIKETEDFIHCKEICLFALNKFGTDEIFVTKVLPIITSVYRNLKEPEKAIDIAKEQKKNLSASPLHFTHRLPVLIVILKTMKQQKSLQMLPTNAKVVELVIKMNSLWFMPEFKKKQKRLKKIKTKK